VAGIGYFYVNADPQQVPAVVGSVVAQGDSNSIGCPIVVDGQVTAERISHEVNAYPQCLVQGA
jgi:Mycobacterium membrane protein